MANVQHQAGTFSIIPHFTLISSRLKTTMELEKIGPYLIESKLGSGGMGTVYKGRHEDTDQLAAVKVLSPSLSREEGFVARFSREVESLRKLSNPHVVEFYESDVDGEYYYFAMEYVEGETLTQRLRREKRIPWRDVIEISTQICLALKSAHDAGVIHRDLKPSNLMLTPDGNVKLTDFGVAQVFASAKLTVTGGIIGTAEYMSPEQAQGKRVTKKSDLYSLARLCMSC
ncbi:MAG: serine/threonine-protein kinase [Planctomycetaceae bacterium]